jgi:hypothetical protein
MAALFSVKLEKGEVMSSIAKFVTRRAVLVAAASAAPLLALGGAEAASLPPTAVGYQASPKDGKRCDGCNLFVAPKSCKSVSGEISPSGWCKLWVKKA